jgi:membrane-associated phospholipid phosphatase
MVAEPDPTETETAEAPRSWAPDGRSAFTRALGRLGYDFTLCILFAVLLVTVGRLFGSHYVLRLSTMLLPGCIAPGIILIRFIPRARAIFAGDTTARTAFRREAFSTIRDWLPLVIVATGFDNLENYTGLVRKITIDASLYHIDLAIFGVEPTVWIRRFYNPLLTDWMASCYGIFLVTPMFLAIAISLRGRREDFREIAGAVMLQMWIAFFIFICLPAGPPRYFAPLRDGPFLQHLPSLLGFNDKLQATWDTYSPLLVRASFPSLHCAYATLTMIYAWRFGDAVFPRRPRLFFYLVVPLEISLIVATIYLRHHWIPDCVAGITLATIVCQLAPWVRRRWPARAVAA